MGKLPSHGLQPYPYGIDYEWFASDSDGHIARFTTAGVGPLPEVVLAGLSLHVAMSDALRNLPERCLASLLVSLPKPDDFIFCATRGLFAYDYVDIHRTINLSGCYEVLSLPGIPLRISDLPGQFHSLLQEVVIPSVRFTDLLKIDIRSFFKCQGGAK